MTKLFSLLLLCGIFVWAILFMASSKSDQRLIFSPDRNTYFTDYLLPRSYLRPFGEMYGRAPNIWTRGCAGFMPALEVRRPFSPGREGGVAFMAISAVLFIFSLACLIKAFGSLRDIWGVALILSLCGSWIFLRTIERGNSIFVASACSFVFLSLFDSSSRQKRILAAIALGLSVALKISPVFLGFLYFIEPFRAGSWWKRFDWPSVILSGIVASLFLLIPFAWGGEFLANFACWHANVAKEAGVHPSTWGLHGIANYASGFVSHFMPWVTIDACKKLTLIIGLGLTCCLVGFSFLRRSSTKSDRLFLLTAVMLILCLNSQFYLGLMLFPSLIFWLKEVDERGNPTRLEYAQLVLWVLMLMPVQIVIAGRTTTMFITFIAFWLLIAIRVWTCFLRLLCDGYLPEKNVS